MVASQHYSLKLDPTKYNSNTKSRFKILASVSTSGLWYQVWANQKYFMSNIGYINKMSNILTKPISILYSLHTNKSNIVYTILAGLG